MSHLISKEVHGYFKLVLKRFDICVGEYIAYRKYLAIQLKPTHSSPTVHQHYLNKETGKCDSIVSNAPASSFREKSNAEIFTLNHLTEEKTIF